MNIDTDTDTDTEEENKNDSIEVLELHGHITPEEMQRIMHIVSNETEM